MKIILLVLFGLILIEEKKLLISNTQKPKEMRPRKVSPVTVTALGGGDLELTFTFLYVSPHPLPRACGPLPSP